MNQNQSTKGGHLQDTRFEDEDINNIDLDAQTASFSIVEPKKVLKLTSKDLLPRTKLEKNYTNGVVKKRQDWLSLRLGKPFKNSFSIPKDISKWKKNIENPIGVCEVPMTVIGPLSITGDHVNETVFVPFATTQGTLADSYQRGSLLVSKAGGVNVSIIRDVMDLDPVFYFSDLESAKQFRNYIVNLNDLSRLNEIVKKSTKHAVLLEIEPYFSGRRVHLQMRFNTHDAMGLNIISIAGHNICEYFKSQFPGSNYYLRSNLTSDKKASYLNIQRGYGKELFAEIELNRQFVKRFLHTSPEQLVDLWYACTQASYQGGVLGHNAHIANGVAAIFLATGQDIAQVVNASTGFMTYELTSKGDLYVGMKMPSLPVATVGGGTTLPHQSEALEMIGCLGANKSKRLAEIICGTVFAGELSLMGAIASNGHADADVSLKNR